MRRRSLVLGMAVLLAFGCREDITSGGSSFESFTYHATWESVVAPDTVYFCDTIYAVYRHSGYPGQVISHHFVTHADTVDFGIQFRVTHDTADAARGAQDTLVIVPGNTYWANALGTQCAKLYRFMNPEGSLDQVYRACFTVPDSLLLTESAWDSFVTSNARCLVVAHSDSCPPCRTAVCLLTRLLADTSSGLAARVYILDTATALSTSLGLLSVPTYLFYQNGAEVGRHVGLVDNAVLRTMMDTVFTN